MCVRVSGSCCVSTVSCACVRVSECQIKHVLCVRVCVRVCVCMHVCMYVSSFEFSKLLFMYVCA